MLLRGSDKYIRAPRPELYRLSADPRERKDLAATHPERAAALAAELDRLVGVDEAPAFGADAAMAEQRRRLEALGYLTGGEAVVALRVGNNWREGYLAVE